MPDLQADRLAPQPDFRYVSFAPAPRSEALLVGAIASGGAVGGLLLLAHAAPVISLISSAFAAAATLVGMRVRGGPVRRWGVQGARLGFTPWGIVVGREHERFARREEDASPRALRWAGLSRIRIETTYGRDGGTPSTLTSTVSVEALGERFVGRTPGAVALDSVLLHLEDYANEQAHVIALDLDGERSGEGPFEPDFEPLLSAALDSLGSAPTSRRLGLATGDYRHVSNPAASPETVELLRAVLTSREPKPIDPRALCVVMAVALDARSLRSEVAALAQSPHPVLAAVARGASRRLGAPLGTVGEVEEVAPFLHPADLDAIEAWSRVPSIDARSVRSTVP